MNRKGKKVVSDINITPFTDVVLVLLIIFMITTPMLSQHEIKVSLPQSAEATEKTEDKVTEILVDKDGFLYLNKKQIHKKYRVTGLHLLFAVEEIKVMILFFDLQQPHHFNTLTV